MQISGTPKVGKFADALRLSKIGVVCVSRHVWSLQILEMSRHLDRRSGFTARREVSDFRLFQPSWLNHCIRLLKRAPRFAVWRFGFSWRTELRGQFSTCFAGRLQMSGFDSFSAPRQGLSARHHTRPRWEVRTYCLPSSWSGCRSESHSAFDEHNPGSPGIPETQSPARMRRTESQAADRDGEESPTGPPMKSRSFPQIVDARVLIIADPRSWRKRSCGCLGRGHPPRPSAGRPSGLPCLAGNRSRMA